MKSRRSESELVKLRRLTKQLARARRETPSTVHLLAAVWRCGGAARELLSARGLNDESIVKAARAFDESQDDAIKLALTNAREVAQRAALPAREVVHATRGSGVRPKAAPALGAIHVLVVLLSNRHYAAYRALVHCGVDVARLRNIATPIALGAVAPPRCTTMDSKPMRQEAPAVERQPALPRGGARKTRPANKERAVKVPLLPPAEEVRARGNAKRAATAARKAAQASKKVRSNKAPARATGKTTSQSKAKASTGLELDKARFPTLVALAKNLTLAAAKRQLDPVIARDAEIEQLRDVLAKRRANSPILVGRAGVGKTSVARGLAFKLAAEFAAGGEPHWLLEISLAELLAGTGARGSLAERMAAIRAEVSAVAGRAILFIDDIHELVANSLADEVMGELKAALDQGDLPLIATTTPAEYRRIIEGDSGLVRRFTVISVVEPNEADAFLLLRSVARGLTEHHGTTYSDEAVALTVSWSKRYLPDRALPDMAVSILDLAGARLRRRTRRSRDQVQPDHVAEVVSELADVPVERLLQTDQQRMLALNELLAERVIGHDEAVDRIAAVLRRNGAGLRGRRPIGTFLLLGPTGVGKTETAKAVAEVLFDSPDAMTRLDMSEFAEAHAVSRLIGAPPGYVGYEAGGVLTEAVRKRPYQVILLDELEKAHRDVLEAFLQVFDEGRLTDGQGRTVDYTNTVLIMTSNLGASELQAACTERRVGFTSAKSGGGPDPQRTKEIATRAAKAALPPELYNRIDEVLFFKHLERTEVAAIAHRLLDDLAATLALKGATLKYDDAVIEQLLTQGGYDAEFGARPMRRVIARLVEGPLAEMILRGELEDGSTVTLRVDGDALVLEALPAARRSA